MAEDTAVLDAPAPESSPPAEEQVTEPENQVEGDEGASDGEEGEALQTFTEADVEKRVKEAEERIKADVEAETHKRNFDFRKQQAVQVRQRTAVDSAMARLNGVAAWMAKQAADGHDAEAILQRMSPGPLAALSNELAQQLDAAMFMEEWEARQNFHDGYIKKSYPDWKPSNDLAGKVTRAVQSLDPQRMTEAQLDYLKAAITESERANLRKEVEKEFAEGNQKAKGTASLAKATNGTRPVSTSGGAASAMPTSDADWDRAYNSGRVSHEQYGKHLKEIGANI